ncbi:hypothetical protein B0H12DRAFT_1259161 [Mycena haematopus]|nr:hypothetical protein B0H12DRAFT_1259161 [Mycena haematopus]
MNWVPAWSLQRVDPSSELRRPPPPQSTVDTLLAPPTLSLLCCLLLPPRLVRTRLVGAVTRIPGTGDTTPKIELQRLGTSIMHASVWAENRPGEWTSVISRAGGRTKSGRNGLGSDTGIKTEGVKVQDGNMVNLCDTTQVVSAQLPGRLGTTGRDEEGVGNYSDDGRRSWWMPKGGRRKAEPREVKGQTPIDAGGRRAAKGGSPEDEWWKI